MDLPDEEGMLNVYFSDYNGAAVQKFISSNGSVRRRMFFDESWNEWEWENPPMEDGVEYRTVEKWNGKPVYVIAKDVTTPDVNTTKKVNLIPKDSKTVAIINISGAFYFPDKSMWDTLDNSNIDIDFIDEYVQEQDGYIDCRIGISDSHYVGCNACIIVKYTKQ